MLTGVIHALLREVVACNLDRDEGCLRVGQLESAD